MEPTDDLNKEKGRPSTLATGDVAAQADAMSAQQAAATQKNQAEFERLLTKLGKTVQSGVAVGDPLPQHNADTMTSLQAAHASLGDAIAKNNRESEARFNFFAEKFEDMALQSGREPGRFGRWLDNVVDFGGSFLSACIGNPKPLSGFIDARYRNPRYNKMFEQMRKDIEELQQIPEAKDEKVGILYDPVAQSYTPISYGATGSLLLLKGGLRQVKRKYRKQLAELRARKEQEVQLAPSGQTVGAQGQQASATAASQNGNKTQPTNSAAGSGQPVSSGQAQAQPVDPAAPVVASASSLKVGAAGNVSGAPKDGASGAGADETKKRKLAQTKAARRFRIRPKV